MMTSIPHRGKQALFALLSLADLALTWWLLTHSAGQVYEANPVAGLLLLRHGWPGLVLFKTGVVLLVLGLSEVISDSRPRAAGRVLGLGCVGLALVVLYSAALCRLASRSPMELLANANRQADRHLEEVNRQAQRDNRKHEAFRALLADLRDELIAGRYTLPEAAARLAASDKGRDPAWLRGLAVDYPDLAPQQQLAGLLIRHVAILQEADSRVDSQIVLRLEEEFRLSYGKLAPAR